MTLPRVIHSEWTKLWSLRSTRWSLLLACVAQAGLGPLIAAIEMARWSHMGIADRVSVTLNPVDHVLGGWTLAQLAVAILGVMTMTGEYHTGMIRSSLMAAPQAPTGAMGEADRVLRGGVRADDRGGADRLLRRHGDLLEQHINVGLGAPGALRALVGSDLFITATGAMCVALGTIVRRTAGGIALYVGAFFVLPGLVEILPSATANAIHPYLAVHRRRRGRAGARRRRAHLLTVGRLHPVLRLHGRADRDRGAAAAPARRLSLHVSRCGPLAATLEHSLRQTRRANAADGER